MRSPKNHHRAVVHRMMESRARKNETIHERHRNANLHTASQSPQHAASRRAMQINSIAHPRITGRNDEGLAIDDEAHMAQKSLVKNAMNSFGIIMPAIRQAAHLRARCRSEFAHLCRLRACPQLHKSQSGSIPIGYLDLTAPRITRKPV